jgi:hypothetical protein
MPEGVRDRPAEVWEALLAIAELAGDAWAKRARDACTHFVLDVDPDELPMGARLLRDVREAFGDRDRMFSVDVVAKLTDDAESEWCDLWGKRLDQNRLARELKRYGVRSKDIRVNAAKAKGYTVDGDDGLGQAWRRYLSDVKRDTRGNRDIAGQCDSEPRQPRDSRDNTRGGRDAAETAEIPSDLLQFENGAGVSAVSRTDGSAPNGHAYRPMCIKCQQPMDAPSSIERGYCEACRLEAKRLGISIADLTAETAATQ